MSNLEGMKMKYVVVKSDDIERLFHSSIQRGFRAVLDTIRLAREMEDKKENTYLVINTDEPYADEVIEIMKRHGHWG